MRFAAPDYGLGQRLNDLHDWLRNEIGPGGYAVHTSNALAGDGLGVYLCKSAQSQALVWTFPDLMLADKTASRVYLSSRATLDWSSPEVFGVCNLYSMTRGQDALREIAKVWEDRPMAMFAGIPCRRTSMRKLKGDKTTDDLFGFLTTEADAGVAAIHPKAMPVILRTPIEIDAWLDGETADALALQRPLPDGTLRILARGRKSDGAEVDGAGAD